MGSCDHSLLVEEFDCGSIDLGLADVGKGLMEDFEQPFCGELESRLVEVGEGCSGDFLLDEDCSDDFEKQFCSELMNDLDSDDATDFEAPAIELREDGLHNEASNLICLAQDEVSHTECGAEEACLHGGNVENEGLCLENKCFLDVSETSLKLLSVTGLRSSCNESDEPKHMDSADSNVGVRVAEAEEGKSKIFEESGFPEGAGEGCEMPPRLIRMNGGSADNPVEEGNDSIGINNSSAESLPGDVGEKGGVNTETGMLPSSICRMSMEGLPTECSLGNSWHYNAENDENSVMYISAERGLEVKHGKREVDSCTYILHSQSNHAQQHDPEDVNRVIGSAVSEVREVREDQGVVVRVESVTFTNGSHVDRSSCNFKEGSQNVTFGDDAEISLLPDASPHVSDSSNGPSKRLDVPNNSLTGVIIAESCSSITTGRFELKGDEDNEGNVCLDGSVTARTSEYIWQSLQRTTRSSTSRRASKKEVVSKKVRKTVAKGSTFHESIKNFSVVSKRKRSCLSKSRRSSVWGSPETILDLFEVNNQHVGRKLIKKSSHDPLNLRCERELRRNDNQEGRSLSGSKEKVQPVNGGIRLRIKIGKQGVSSVMMLTSEPETIAATDLEATGKNRQDALIDISGEEVPISRPFQCIKKQAENLELQLDASYLDVHRYDKRLENTINLCKSPRNEAGEIEVEVANGTENKHIDPGTSPDSEVINQSPDASVGVRVQESLQDAPMTSSSDLASTGDIKQLNLPCMNSQKGRKKDKTGISNCADLATSISSEQSKKCGTKKEMADRFNSHETSENIEKPPPSSKMKGHIPTKSFKSRENGTSKSDNLDVMGSRREIVRVHKDVDKHSDEKEVIEGFFCKVESNPEIGILGIDDSGRTNASDKSGSEEKSYMDMVQTGELESSVPPRNAWVSCDECQKWRRIPATLADSIEETNSKWTCIDNMDKAFANCSTPQEKSNSEINVELDISDAEDAADCGITNSKGLERRHAAASQPSSWNLIKSNLFKHRRRKTQAIDEIMVCYCKPRANGRPGCGDACLNRVLNIECIRGTCPCGDSCSNQQFQKKSYAKLKCFRCGKKGYGLQLLEDISKGQFLIEYVGEVLDLHAYEARQLEYASRGHTHFYFMTLSNTEVIDACAKGNLGRFINHSCDPNCRTEKWMVNGEICIGLFAIRDIKKDEELTFDYNYVRVFGAAAKKCVCGSSQCRGYIGGDPSSTEVIVQGDSDDEYPEPVMVLENGEKINSLDSLADKANSYIQEDTQTGEASKGRNSIDEASAAVGQLEITRENEECSQRSTSAVLHFKSSSENVTPIETVPPSIQLVEHPIETEEATSKPIPIARQNIIDEDINQSLCPSELKDHLASVPEKLISDSHDDGKISQSDKVEGNSVSSKSQPMIKKSKSSRSAKKEKHKTNLVTANKSQLTPNKTKKALERTVTGRYEAVEEKLNELLDADGGISKQKDASKGYLKLLLLTAASGDSVNGEAIQSNRELSLLLEVLLKTKSRVVLVDIINKNGLRMLHNIMKQSRKEYTKTPILRKLLKVLEYLATKGILTSEHINVGPPCPGMESFRKSILTLTEHSNKQVHQIARNFRDRWLRQPLRKNECRKRDDDKNGSNGNRHGTSHRQDHGVRAIEATDIKVGTKMPFTASSSSGTHEEGSVRNVSDGLTSGTKTRKRKSRWDEPAPTSTDLVSLPYKEQKLEPIESIVQPDLGIVVQKDECVTNHIRQEASSRENDSGVQPMQEDAPPGFCFPPDSQLVSPSISSDLPEVSIGHAICTFETVTGHPQERFRSCLPVSYGIPLSLLKQNVTPETANVDGWTNAPGVAFHPFPPLPSYPPNDRNPSSCSVKYLAKNEVGDVQTARCGSATYHTDQSSQSTSSAGQAGADFVGTGNQYGFGRARMNSIDLRKRFRQKKWNGNNFSPPWPKRRSKWDQMGNNPGNGMCNIDMDSVQNEPKDPYFSEDMSRRVQQNGINFYQQHRQNH